MAAYAPGQSWAISWEDDTWAVDAWGAGVTPIPPDPPTPIVQTGWNSADLYNRFLLYMGRGTGGNMQSDELWSPTRVYEILADAQEDVYTDLLPRCTPVFSSAPIRLTTTDGGVTYDFPTWPMGHTEIYARLSGGWELRASSYGDLGGDFVFEGNRIRSVGNVPRTYGDGPYARFHGYPVRMSAAVEPMIQPPSARTLILYRALAKAADVFGAQYDPGPWEKKFQEQRKIWLANYATQLSGPQAGNMAVDRWWLRMSNLNQLHR